MPFSSEAAAVSSLISSGSLTTRFAGIARSSAKNLFSMLRSEKIKVAINQRFNLAQTADAFRALTARKTTGVTLIETGL